MKVNKPTKILLMIIALIIILEGSYSGFRFLTTFPGYITGYQGAQARFAGIEYDDEQYSGLGFTTTISWDPDTRGSGEPGIAGEMTAVFVPKESVGEQTKIFGTGADISDWLLESTNIKNPVQVYEWELPVENNKTAFYRMEEWQLKWYFSISCEVSNIQPLGGQWKTGEIPVSGRHSLKDVKVWFEFDLTPIWSFEGTNTAYFAIAKLQISDIAIGGKLESGEYDQTRNSECRVIPQSAGSIISIYYGLFASEANKADKEAYVYNGKKLNPDLFTDVVYGYFTLNDFGVNGWPNWPIGHKWRGDVVTIGVDVHVFVIGEWTVKDIQEIPDEYGREATTGMTGIDFGALINSPTGRLILVALAAIAVLLILAIFAPWVLFAIFSLLGGRKRR